MAFSVHTVHGSAANTFQRNGYVTYFLSINEADWIGVD